MQSMKNTASAECRIAANQNNRIRLARVNADPDIPEHRPRLKLGHSYKTTTSFQRDAAGGFVRCINRQPQAPDDVMIEVAPGRYLNEATALALGFIGRQSKTYPRAADVKIDSYLVPSPHETDKPFDNATTPAQRKLARAIAWHRHVAEAERVAVELARIAERQGRGDPACLDFHPPVRVGDTPRHRGLSERLASLLTWRAASRPTVELATNWRLVPKNGERGADEEDIPEEDDEPQRQLERDKLMETRPKVKEMLQMFGDGVDVERGSAVKRKRWDWPSKEQKVPGPSIRINGLRFSNGAAQEPCFVWEGGKVVWGKVTMPAGALMRYGAGPGRLGFRTIDKFTEMRGPDNDDDRSVSAKEELDVSNAFWASELRTLPHRYIPADRRRRRKRIMTQAEQIELLADNDNWPPVTKYPAGLPCGQKRVADAFLGGCHASTGNSAGVGNPNPVMDQREADEIRAAVSKRDQTVLDAALTAQTFEEIGEVIGKSGKTAERAGKQALLDAAGRLAHALNKMAA